MIVVLGHILMASGTVWLLDLSLAIQGDRRLGLARTVGGGACISMLCRASALIHREGEGRRPRASGVDIRFHVRCKQR